MKLTCSDAHLPMAWLRSLPVPFSILSSFTGAPHCTRRTETWRIQAPGENCCCFPLFLLWQPTVNLNWTFMGCCLTALRAHSPLNAHILMSSSAKMERGAKPPAEGTTNQANCALLSFASQHQSHSRRTRQHPPAALSTQDSRCKFGCFPEPAMLCTDMRAVWALALDSFCSNCFCSCHTQDFCSRQMQTAPTARALPAASCCLGLVLQISPIQMQWIRRASLSGSLQGHTITPSPNCSR